MPSCAVDKCRNNSSRVNKRSSGLTFHLFPQHKQRRNAWTLSVRNQRREENWAPSECSKICSAHFRDADFYITKKGRRRLHKHAVPVFQQSWQRTQPPDKPSRKRVVDSDSDQEEDEDGSGNDEPGGADEKHHTSDKESQAGKFRFSSADVLIPESTNATLDQELLMDLHELSDKIQNFYPMLVDRQFTLCFQGEDGDKNEYIFTSASDTRRNGERHASLTCNECSAHIVGFRYKCVSCSDYDLCASCEALGTHAHHVMMRIAKPIKFKQARTLLKRWCDAMKAAGVATMEEITGEAGGEAGDVTTGGGSSAAQSKPSNSKGITSAQIGISLKSKMAGTPLIQPPPKKPNRPPIVKSSIVSFKGKTVTKKSSGPEAKKRKSEDLKKKESSYEVRQNVKQEREESNVPEFYSPFTQAEPTLSVANVKLEDPDPLDTERVVKEEYRMDFPLSLDVPAWPDGGPGGAAPAGAHDPHAVEVDLGGVFETFTHHQAKHESH